MTNDIKNAIDFITNITKHELIKNLNVILKSERWFVNHPELSGKLYRKWNDLYEMLTINVPTDGDMKTNVYITKEILDRVGVEEDDAFNLAEIRAKINTDISPMGQVMINLASKNGMDSLEIPAESFYLPLVITSKDNGVEGAIGVIFTDKIAEIANAINCDLIIMPSSIHEVLVDRADRMSEREVLAMVRSINAICVSEQDFLSDNVYKFTRETKDWTIIS